MFHLNLDWPSVFAVALVATVVICFLFDMRRQRKRKRYQGFVDYVMDNRSRIVVVNHEGVVSEITCQTFELTNAGIKEGDRFIMIKGRKGLNKFKRLKGKTTRSSALAKSKEEMVM